MFKSKIQVADNDPRKIWNIINVVTGRDKYCPKSITVNIYHEKKT